MEVVVDEFLGLRCCWLNHHFWIQHQKCIGDGEKFLSVFFEKCCQVEWLEFFIHILIQLDFEVQLANILAHEVYFLFGLN